MYIENDNLPNSASIDTFRRAWYAFATCQSVALDTEMKCPKCGSEPDTVIVDAAAYGHGLREGHGKGDIPTRSTPGISPIYDDVQAGLSCYLTAASLGIASVHKSTSIATGFRKQLRQWADSEESSILLPLPDSVLELSKLEQFDQAVADFIRYIAELGHQLGQEPSMPEAVQGVHRAERAVLRRLVRKVSCCLYNSLAVVKQRKRLRLWTYACYLYQHLAYPS